MLTEARSTFAVLTGRLLTAVTRFASPLLYWCHRIYSLGMLSRRPTHIEVALAGQGFAVGRTNGLPHSELIGLLRKRGPVPLRYFGAHHLMYFFPLFPEILDKHFKLRESYLGLDFNDMSQRLSCASLSDQLKRNVGVITSTTAMWSQVINAFPRLFFLFGGS